MAKQKLNINVRDSANFFVSIVSVVVILMLIIPLPAVILDFLMACNVLLSVLILLIVLYSSRAIDFSSFPTLILLTTVFGLGINVSSTRLILAKGTKFDGRMVRAFSEFVVGSDGTEGLLIGFVIFIIIIAVQMIITKGASRVAEVAARFTLDQLPTKQMAIDAEFNSGTITESEAKYRKQELQLESDFYGNMDGASKFVSGNVKVGIFITVVNLVVGLIFGMVLRNESFSVAIQTYASLTIGDGLLSQLPSLLISFATGLIVTRSPANEGASLGDDVKKQFSKNALVFCIGGVIMAFIGFLPGFPVYILLPMGIALVFMGYKLQKSTDSNSKDVASKNASGKVQEKAAKTAPQDISPVVPLDTISLELGFSIITLLDETKGGNLKERISLVRRDIGLDLGLVVPAIHIQDNIELEHNEYAFKIKGVEIQRGKVRTGCLLAMNTGGVTEEISGEKTSDPVFGLPAIWITEENREKAERLGYAVVDPATVITTHITEIIRHNAADILGRQEVHRIIETLRKDYDAVVSDVEKLNFTTGHIQKVMQGLLREQVSVRNMVEILETMADYGAITQNTDILIEKVRQRLARQISLQYADGDSRVLHVITVNPSILQVMIQNKLDTMNGPIVAWDIAMQQAWIAEVSKTIVSVQNSGYVPIILVHEEARRLVKASIDRELPGVVVLAVQEIIKDIKVESLGEINVKL